MKTVASANSMKAFMSVNDVGNTRELLDLAGYYKSDPVANQYKWKGKRVVLLFFNPSLRTRLSTTCAAQNLGMDVITMDLTSGWNLEFDDGSVMNLDKAEHVQEAAGVISQYADIIGIRSFAGLTDRDRDYTEFVLNQFARYAKVPVLNLESATRHPLQGLTDLMTIEESKVVSRPRVVLTWAPHPRILPQAVPNSFVSWMKTECELVVACPEGFELSPTILNGTIVTHDQASAFEGADFVYAKNWSSYEDYGYKSDDHKEWIVNEQKMDLTNNAKFMHCLPVRRNVVVTDEVLDSESSLTIVQARNRVYAAQAVIDELLSSSEFVV